MTNFFSNKAIKQVSILSLTALFMLSGCEPPPAPEDKQAVISDAKPVATIKSDIDTQLAQQLSDGLWQSGSTLLSETQQEASLLLEANLRLLDEPGDKALLDSDAQWEKLFLHYQKLVPYTYIEHPSLADSLNQWRFTIAAWPMQPGYLDSYGVYIQSGIVNDITLAITTTTLRNQHGLTDAEEVTLGLYAIEFILKGDKSDDPAKRFIQQTKVPLKLAQAGLKIHELPNNRRRQLLKLQSQLLAEDLNAFAQQWQADGLFKTLFMALTPLDKIKAYHHGQVRALDELQNLLHYETGVETEEQDKDTGNTNNHYQQRFKNHRHQAVSTQLASIESIYNDEVIDGESDKKITLLDTLTEEEQEKVKTKIEVIKKQLNK